MAIRSMTGFGRGEASCRGFLVEVEIGSVNRKQLDVHVSLPKSLASLEPLAVKETGRCVSRGHLTVSVRIGTAKEGVRKMRLNADEIAAGIADLRKIARKLRLKDDLSACSLLSLPAVAESWCAELDADTTWPAIRKALREALRRLTDMRRKEGEALGADLKLTLAGLDERLDLIRKLAPGVVANYRVLLANRLREAGIKVGNSGGELARELALFADRCDISEEIVRLDSHLSQAVRLLSSGKPVGRTLDFLAQEIFREINTIGAKANDADISRHVIAFKTDTERFREQVQNVE